MGTALRSTSTFSTSLTFTPSTTSDARRWDRSRRRALHLMLSTSLRVSRRTPVIWSLSQLLTLSIIVVTTNDAYAILGSWMKKIASWDLQVIKNNYLVLLMVKHQQSNNPKISPNPNSSPNSLSNNKLATTKWLRPIKKQLNLRIRHSTLLTLSSLSSRDHQKSNNNHRKNPIPLKKTCLQDHIRKSLPSRRSKQERKATHHQLRRHQVLHCDYVLGYARSSPRRHNFLI